jgi:hypothetical protein
MARHPAVERVFYRLAKALLADLSPGDRMPEDLSDARRLMEGDDQPSGNKRCSIQ